MGVGTRKGLFDAENCCAVVFDTLLQCEKATLRRPPQSTDLSTFESDSLPKHPPFRFDLRRSCLARIPKPKTLTLKP